MNRRTGIFILYFLSLIATALLAAAAGAAEPAGESEPAAGTEIVFKEGLAVGPVGRYGRSAIHSDPLEYRLAGGKLDPPREGDLLATAGDGQERRWAGITAGEDGWFRGDALRRGYLYISLQSESSRVMILEAAGHSFVHVNGEPRGGDVYAYGWIRHPVRIEKGCNDFYFRSSRGRVKARLVEPGSAISFAKTDMTLPHLLLWEDRVVWGAVRVVNATGEELRGLAVRCSVDGGEPVETMIPVVGPMTSRKVGFRIRPPVPETTDSLPCRIELVHPGGSGEEIAMHEFQLGVASPAGHHNTTFISEIDGSVQYYGVSPGRIEGDERPGLVLTCHGAGVEGSGQARCYAAKSWAHVVAATNRRAYGFDWEDWGRLDAMEVLAIAEKRFGTDPKKTYLTGHSMGGHGTWYLGVTFPGRFAAIGPSAGWYSFWSYGGKKKDADATGLEKLFARASNPSDTIGVSRNYLHHGIYILHGDADDNVPVTQARFMREHLSGYHADFAYYEKPGAGHWWGGRCCDWPPLFEFFKNHAVPDNRDAKSVEFWTVNPGISARSRWVTVEAQERSLDFSFVKLTQDVAERTFKGETENVSRLALDLAQLDPGDAVTVDLDGTVLEAIPTPEKMKVLRLVREGDAWKPTDGEPDPGLKGPHRYGTFKDAFRHRVLFVYGTVGTEAENAWSYDKARYDAETFWYRGNASVDVVADTNSAWQALLGGGPVRVARDGISVGDRELAGDDLGCYFVRPRPGSDIASVGVVAGTGPAGMQAASANMYFIAGSGFPDLLVFGADMLRDHFQGVRVAGYFGVDWSVEHGEFAWRE